MKRNRQSRTARENPGKGESNKRESGSKPEKSQRRLRKVILVLLIVVAIFALGRALMPWAVRDYVNRTLDRNPLYSGRIGPVSIHLWRGAYSIDDVNISKTTGNVPVPFFSAKRIDFAIQWGTLLHRKIVGRVLMVEPVVNFVQAKSDEESQIGGGGPWLQVIQELFPFDINRAVVQDGSVHFHVFQSDQPVDVYLSKVELTVDNLSNIHNETKPLVSTVKMTALAMDQAQFELIMTLDPFSYRPTFHLATRLLGLDVTTVNNLALTYGKFDFKRGWFDLVLEMEANEGQISGYIKPLFRNLKLFSLRKDIKEDSVVQFFWQAVMGATTTLLKNFPRDQFGTVIPFTADATGTTSADILATIGNVLRNAFIRAYLPLLQNGQQSVEGLHFSPPDVTSPISPAGS
jgi:hypothetical protein